ncbi:MAG: ATP-binding cassette domain-containing protein [Candidatus Latescibacteria bacterium]|nr:ATP-binding cassette domain-containing protein [Candidatus Latescibacterota bacterium]NIM64497.1 ATP-binding cassette domain-containing protein [Candidatus Latescibacterota bacterium]NIO00650.1 ATP-binding cassette domain-containing protein [Candidatus Latescibacterota bacterium]NIO27053.1 ATP-binding cassette domain-containing protein [Candidatus Latescibacterota bacterium]NIO54577.1 ATP-binding cassette domain-containing protein [Candidatus Latescibacterota bacterium]
MDARHMLIIENISKQYDGVRAIDRLSLSIEQGLIYGLLGPNGAGKTTTIRMIMKIILPDEGSIEIFGDPLQKVKKERIGYLPEERGLYKKMRVQEMLAFFGEIKKMDKGMARKAAGEWLEKLDLADYARKKVEDLSKGMQQKVQFISTVIHSPELIILDEPFAGLDPVNVNILKDIILEFRKKSHTIIFSTHMMEQVEKLCDSICLIDKGKKVLEGRLTDIKKQYGRNSVTLRFNGDGSFIGDLPEVDNVSDYGNEVFLRLKEGADSRNVLKAAADRLEVLKFEVAEPSIHDIFIEQVSSK